MDTIDLNLRPGYSRAFQKWFSIIVILYALIVVILMLTSVIPMNIYLALSAAVLLAQVIFNWDNIKAVNVKFDDNGIFGSVNPHKTISLRWDQVDKIEVHIFAIDIQTKDNRIEHIDLGQINFEQQKIIKPKIIELSKSKGINIQIVS